MLILIILDFETLDEGSFNFAKLFKMQFFNRDRTYDVMNGKLDRITDTLDKFSQRLFEVETESWTNFCTETELKDYIEDAMQEDSSDDNPDISDKDEELKIIGELKPLKTKTMMKRDDLINPYWIQDAQAVGSGDEGHLSR